MADDDEFNRRVPGRAGYGPHLNRMREINRRDNDENQNNNEVDEMEDEMNVEEAPDEIDVEEARPEMDVEDAVPPHVSHEAQAPDEMDVEGEVEREGERELELRRWRQQHVYIRGVRRQQEQERTRQLIEQQEQEQQEQERRMGERELELRRLRQQHVYIRRVRRQQEQDRTRRLSIAVVVGAAVAALVEAVVAAAIADTNTANADSCIVEMEMDPIPEEQQQVAEEHEQEEEQQANMVEEERGVAEGDEVEASNDPPVPSNDPQAVVEASDEPPLPSNDPQHTQATVPTLPTENQIEKDKKKIEKAARNKEKSRRRDEIKVELCKPQGNNQDADFQLPEIDQIYADVGFSYENIELLEEFYRSHPELKIGLKTDTKEDKIIAVIHYGLRNLRDPSKNTPEAAVEFKNRLTDVIMENDTNGVYSERLNLGQDPDPIKVLLAILNYSPPSCIGKEEKIPKMNPCIYQVWCAYVKSILHQACPLLTPKQLEEECDRAWSKIAFIDRSILVAKDKDKYTEELETFCNDVGIPYKYYHILPMILIGNQAKISKKHNNKPMMMSTFGSLPTRYIRGTPAHKSSNTCVRDAGSNPHPEVVAAGYIKNGKVFSEAYLLQLCENIQLFICGMESVRALIPVGHQTTFYLRRAERTVGVDDYERVFTEEQIDSRYGGKKQSQKSKDKQGSRGYDSTDQSELEEEMQSYRGTHHPDRWTERQRLLLNQKGKASPRQNTCEYVDGVCCNKQRHKMSTSGDCIVCINNFNNNVHQKQIVNNELTKPINKKKDILDIVHNYGFIHKTKAGCKNCDVYLCLLHYQQFQP